MSDINTDDIPQHEDPTGVNELDDSQLEDVAGGQGAWVDPWAGPWKEGPSEEMG